MTNTLEEILHEYMHARRLTLAAAESCTGGLLSDRITNVSGSSEYFPGGIVTYSNEAKANLLGVSINTLKVYGAVSKETVLEMARAARKLFNADIGISVSGIAGPAGGTLEKPVGTTWLGLSVEGGEWARHFIWNGDRLQNKRDSSEAALQFVIDYFERRIK